MTSAHSDDVVASMPAMLRYATVLTRDRSAAEDLVHDALADALAGSRSYDPHRPLRPWLLAIVRNRFLSDRRRDRTRDRYLEGRGQQGEGEPEGTVPQEQVIGAHELARAVAALPLDQREVLHLIAVEGLTYREAAAALDVPMGTIMSRLSRARARLRVMVDEDGDAKPGLRLVGRSTRSDTR